MRSLNKPTASLAAIVVTCGLAAGAHAQGGPSFPPLMNPPTQDHLTGKMVLAELTTPDIAQAEQFYGGLFGWTFQDTKLGSFDFVEASAGGHVVAALFSRKLPADHSHGPAWLTVLSAKDVDAVTTAATQRGATVLRPAHDLPGFGREAVYADPQGAVFAAFTSASGDPPDVLAQPGQWIWSALITTDPDAAAGFYQAVFDYEVYDLPGPGDAGHMMLADDEFARAAVNPMPVSRPDARAYWLDFVRVDDAAAAVAKATSLGGRVLVAPRMDRHGGRIAVIADPAGAPFGIMEWPSNVTTGAPK